MFEKIKVLVVDDSAFMRKMISDMINSQPDMTVIDTAKDGESAILKAQALSPDVITLDIEMPKKNGLEALKIIKEISKSQVVMVSSLTAEGSLITIEALRLGAFDFIQKPSGSISLDIDKVKEDLVEKIRYAKGHLKKIKSSVRNLNENRVFISTLSRNRVINALVLGASTGGPRVLYDVITRLPEKLGIPVFVVQHMPPGFTKAFAERINSSSSLDVVEAKDGDIIRQNCVYIAPGGYHMLIKKDKIKLDTTPPLHGVRPAADKLFISASESYNGNVLGVVLTGMGKDGAAGVKAIKERGGLVIAQDEATSTVYGMPKAAFETGCVDMVLPDYRICDEIVKMVKRT
ncbi:protein-glutamate methylesterase/protein-glutamine glutaminase [Fonticella tunisiensis]|uniref:Protein-glutamate methylesterase/protein-glutamine glutaminase n=1 Tax=Fonticella tunisiensis TaxID=1096341 RepID=A0A4R7K9D4_9CLOT|nr:chemotaxis response regulator protein-glutamate methylesterase [Fonticella tunisiensis]TDT50633.1 two-component system chemotaxis response regulator CheB [Fonticella tunisiensis]